MKRSIAALAATFLALPAWAHEVEAAHTHAGGSVIYHISPFLVLGTALAVLALAYVLNRMGKLPGSDRHDPR